jgi:type I restriction enzyme S subunit
MKTTLSVPKLRFREFSDKWQKKRLGDIAKIYDGTHQTPSYTRSGVPFYSVEQVTGNDFENTKFISEEVYQQELKRVVVEKGDILMTRIGDIGTAKYISWDVRASFYVSLALIKQSEEYNSQFLEQYIKTDLFQNELWQRTIHVAFPKKINLGEIGNCEIVVPSIQEQEKIAKFLIMVDEFVATLQKKISLLKKYKEGVTQAIFTQKLRFMDENNTPFPDWQEKKLGDLFKISSSKRVYETDWRTGGVPFYRTREVLNLIDGKKIKNPIFIEESLYRKYISTYGAIEKGDMLVTGVGTIGKMYVVKGDHDFYFKDGNVIWLKHNPNVSSGFMYHYFQTRFIKKQINDNASITTVGTYTIDDAKKTRVSMPDIKEQRKIAEFLTIIDDKVKLEERKLEQTKNFKKALLQQMFV